MLPILLQTDSIVLYSYPLFMGLAWGIAYQIYFSLTQKEEKKSTLIIYWGVFFSSWIGAKVLFLLTHPDASEVGGISFWTGGGFVFYGGLLAGLIFVLTYRRINRKVSMSLLWPIIPALTFGHGVGRLGCFLAGCCFGKPTEWFWGIYLHEAYRHPTQLLEAFSLFALGGYLLKKREVTSKKELISNYFLVYGVLRLFIETLRGDSARGEWGLLTPSQWISLLLMGMGLFLKVLHKKQPLKDLKVK